MTRMRIRPVVGIPIAVLCAAVGGWLIFSFIRSFPPDPAAGDAGRVVAYLLDGDFHGLPIAERRAYIEALIKRYGEMTEEQRKLVDEQVKRMREKDPGRMRDQMVRIWKDYVVSEGTRYLAIPPADRPAWLEQRMAAWKNMMPGGRGGPGGRGRGGEGDKGGDERDRPMDEVLTPERQRKVLGFFQNEVMPRTSAADRAVVTLLARDVMIQFREDGPRKRTGGRKQ